MKALRRSPAGAALVAVALLLSGPAAAQGERDFAGVEIEVLPVQGNVYMLIGAGGNTTVQVGSDGVLVVDTQFAGVSDKLLRAIGGLSSEPIRYVVNTHSHGDHIGGNEALILAGNTIAGGNVARTIGDANLGAKAIAHENVLLRMLEQQPQPPQRAWPTDTYVEKRKEVHFNGEAVRILHQPAAHTDGDSIVHFRVSDVISTGDIFVTTGYPFIDTARGGHIEGIIAALNASIEIAVPKDRQEGGTMIVPGHGRISDEADVVEYRDMLTIIRDRVRHMIDAGLTLVEVRAAQPTADYDPRYGSDSGFWTTADFIDTVYRNLGEGGEGSSR
jgi:glyoxylase-like metal-dependent hydrolase (beta-lactamase superfamily II)